MSNKQSDAFPSDIKEGGIVPEHTDEVHTPPKGNQAFDQKIIAEAYKRFFEGHETIEQINKWIKEQGITSWELKEEKKEKDGKSFVLPEISIVSEGYLMDKNSEVSNDPNREEGKLMGQAYTIPGIVGKPTHTVHIIKSKYVLGNVLPPKEMEQLLSDIDAVAQYEVLGDSADEETKQRALLLKDLTRAQSESIDIPGLLETSRAKYTMFKNYEAPSAQSPEANNLVLNPEPVKETVSPASSESKQ